MYVNRRTFIVKGRKMDEAVALFKDLVKDFPHPVRLYVTETGPFDILVWEGEYENLAEYERLTKEYIERITPEWWEKWDSVTENGGSNEIWRLV